MLLLPETNERALPRYNATTAAFHHGFQFKAASVRSSSTITGFNTKLKCFLLVSEIGGYDFLSRFFHYPRRSECCVLVLGRHWQAQLHLLTKTLLLAMLMQIIFPRFQREQTHILHQPLFVPAFCVFFCLSGVTFSWSQLYCELFGFQYSASFCKLDIQVGLATWDFNQTYLIRLCRVYIFRNN